MRISTVRPHGGGSRAPGAGRLHALAGYVLFAALVYVPILATAPGRVVADTKSYLYLDPARFLGRVATLWDPNIGLGTVTHQSIGYLFPLGPFYWVTEVALGLPAWVAQRLWLGSLLFAAGLGMRYLLRTLGIRGAGVPVAVLAYSLSPYALEFSARLSVLLGPWAALPFLLAFTIRALRHGGWKYPALFAITVQIVGGVNATALLYALLGPAAWLVWSVLVSRETNLGRAWAAVWRTGLLTGLTSLWWVIGLYVEGQFGMGILRFTESIETVSATSTASEVLRGLGYWFFYGGDVRGSWNDAVLDFTNKPWLIAVSFGIPALGMLAGGMLRWRQRAFFVFLVILGLVVAVAASPFHDPTAVGALFRAFATSSTAGFALRSTARAVPLLSLGLSVLLGVGVSTLADSFARRGRRVVGPVAAIVVGALCIANAPGLWNGRYYSGYLERDEKVPRYWTEALTALDQRGADTRVLTLPGSDFAAYRWGGTIDPIEPGLMDRPSVARELVPWGGDASTNLLIAVDRRVQSRLLDPNAIAPIARLIGAGDVLLRMDLQTDQFSIVSARDLWKDLTSGGVPRGLTAPKLYGARIPGKPLGENLSDPSAPAVAEPKPVAVLAVRDPSPIVRTKSASDPLILDGDGEGLVDSASAGLVDANRVVLYSPSYATSPEKLRRLVSRDAVLLVTDSNRRRGLRWSGMRNNYGYTEQAGERPLQEDLLDQRLDVFPDSSYATGETVARPTADRARTVTELRGAKSIQATSYGTPSFGFSPDARPALAFDDDPRTAWEVASGVSKVGPERLRVVLDHPITAESVTLQQAQRGPRGRWITHVGLRFDGGPEIHRTIKRSIHDQVVTIPRQTFSTFEIQIEGTQGNAVGPVPTEKARRRKSGVGFAEIKLRDDAPSAKTIRVHEITRLPLDLLGTLGRKSADHALGLLMTGAEADLARRFVLPTAREFGLSGAFNVNPLARDNAIDVALGIPGVEGGGILANSSARFSNIKARASAAFDGDIKTAWNSRDRNLRGQWVDVSVASPITVDHMDLALVEDGRHSILTRFRITSDDGTSRIVDVPRGQAVDGVTSAPVSFAPITGRRFRIVIEDLERRTTFGANKVPITLPIGLVEAGITGVRRAPLPAQLPTGCTTDRLRVDGRPVAIRVHGSTADALEGRALPFEPCVASTTVALTSGSHEIRGGTNRSDGLGLSRVLLSSDANGGATTPEIFIRRAETRAPRFTTVDRQRTSTKVRVSGANAPYWLVLGQSRNAGWHATVNGRDLGAAQLVDGFANGWLITPRPGESTATITMAWTPQRLVWVALAISVIAMIGCIAIVAIGGWRRRRSRAGGAQGTGAEMSDEPDRPASFVHPFGRDGAAMRPIPLGLTALGAGLATAVLVRPVWGLIPLVLVGVSLQWPRARGLLRLLPAVLGLFIAAYVSTGQFRHNYQANFDWPIYFERMRNVGWLAVILLASDVLVGRVLRARSAAPSPAPVSASKSLLDDGGSN